jgi:hypothetical protein
MQPLTAFPLPLETGASPAGYARSECAPSDLSTTIAFETGFISMNETDSLDGVAASSVGDEAASSSTVLLCNTKN